MTLFSKLTWWLAGAGLIIYGLSFLGYIFPLVGLVLFFIILIVVLNLTLKKLEYGVLIVLFELILGHKGYLFSWDIGGKFVLSLRLAIFLLVMIVWLISALRQKKVALAKTPYWLPLIALAAVIIGAILIGHSNGHDWGASFFDWNGYLYLAIAFPLFEVVKKPNFLSKVLSVLVGGVIAMSLLCLFLFGDFLLTKQWARPDLASAIMTESATAEEAAAGQYAFGGITNRLYDESGKPAEYRWQKDLGLGMISYVGGRFFRVSASGQTWTLAGFLLALYLLLRRPRRHPETKYLIGLLLASGLTLAISFSRSLWIGAGGGLLAMLFFLPRKKALQFIGVIVILIVIGAAGIYFLSPSTFQTMGDRLSSIINPSQELAGQNRLNLLEPIMVKIKNTPISGQGFGTPIIYESVVPEKQGFIKVFMYEWGYLDQLVKYGILGLSVFVWLLVAIFRTAKSAVKNLASASLADEKYILIGLLVAVIGLLCTHITSPYLNHPLGLGLILITAAFAYNYPPSPIGEEDPAKWGSFGGFRFANFCLLIRRYKPAKLHLLLKPHETASPTS